MKNMISGQIEKSIDMILKVNDLIFENSSEEKTRLYCNQIFKNYNIKPKDLTIKGHKIISGSTIEKNGPKILLIFYTTSPNNLIKRWQISMSSSIILGSIIGINRIIDNLNGQVSVMGVPYNSLQVISENNELINNYDICLLINCSDETRESGCSMSVKTISVTYINDFKYNYKNNLIYSNPMDALLLLLNSVNVIQNNIPSHVFIRYIIDKTGNTPIELPNEVKLTFAISASNDKLRNEAIELILYSAKSSAYQSKVNISISDEEKIYNTFNSNSILNRLFCHNLKEVGFKDILSSKCDNNTLLSGSISNIIPSIYPTIGYKGSDLSIEIKNRLNSNKSKEHYSTIIDGANVCAYTLYDILSKNNLLDEINNSFNIDKNMQL